MHNQHSTGNPIGVVAVEFTPSPPCFPEVVRPFVFFPAPNSPSSLYLLCIRPTQGTDAVKRVLIVIYPFPFNDVL